MSRLAVMAGIMAFVLLVGTSLVRAIASAPGTFGVVLISGAVFIAVLAVRGEGAWNPQSKKYPPYEMMLKILLISLLISWVAGSKPTTLNSCPPNVGRWC